MEEKMNIIAEAIYKACANTKFECEYTRTAYAVKVNFGLGNDFWAIEIGVAGYKEGMGTVYTFPDDNVTARTIDLEEALKLITEGFSKEGVEFSYETAA